MWRAWHLGLCLVSISFTRPCDRVAAKPDNLRSLWPYVFEEIAYATLPQMGLRVHCCFRLIPV
jgi:hypothetical protein